jgi:hypothetical protein
MRSTLISLATELLRRADCGCECSIFTPAACATELRHRTIELFRLLEAQACTDQVRLEAMEWRLVTFVLVLLLLAVRIDAAYYSPEDKRHYYPEYKLRAKAAHDLARTHVVGETLASAAGVYNNKTRSAELGIMRTVMITVIQYSEKSYYKLYFYNLLCFARHHDIDLVVYVVHHGLKDWEGEVKSYAAMGVKVLPYPDELFWSLLYSKETEIRWSTGEPCVPFVI